MRVTGDSRSLQRALRGSSNLKTALVVGIGGALASLFFGVGLPLWAFFLLGVLTGFIVAIVRDIIP